MSSERIFSIRISNQDLISTQTAIYFHSLQSIVHNSVVARSEAVIVWTLGKSFSLIGVSADFLIADCSGNAS